MAAATSSQQLGVVATTSSEQLGAGLASVLGSLDERVAALRELLAIRGGASSQHTLQQAEAQICSLETEVAMARGVIVREAALLDEARQLQRCDCHITNQVTSLMARLPPHLPGDAELGERAVPPPPIGREPLASIASREASSNSSTSNISSTKQAAARAAQPGRSRRVPPKMELVTESELLSAPAYMRSRLDVVKLNGALSELQRTVERKYELLGRPPSAVRALSEPERKRHTALKALETEETRGSFFVSEDDLKESGSIKADASGKNLLAVLRHVGRLREFKHGGIRCWKLI